MSYFVDSEDQRDRLILCARDELEPSRNRVEGIKAVGSDDDDRSLRIANVKRHHRPELLLTGGVPKADPDPSRGDVNFFEHA